MYRHQRQDFDTGRDTTYQPHFNFSGLNCYNGSYLREMYLDSGTPTSSLSLSPISTDSSMLSSSYSSMTSAVGYLQQSAATPIYNNFNGCGMSSTFTGPENSVSSLEDIQQSFGNTSAVSMLPQQYQQQQMLQQQRILLQQQQQHHETAAIVAKQQLALAAAANDASHQRDEISKSLQLFAALTEYSTGNETVAAGFQPAPVDDVMKEFASNGFVADDSNCYQEAINPEVCGVPATIDNYESGQLGNSTWHMSNNINQIYQQLCQQRMQLEQQSILQQQQQQALRHLVDNRHMLGQLGPSTLGHNEFNLSAVVAAANAAANAVAIENFHPNNQKKLPKRYNGTKDKCAPIKHCVFCDNNNEPDAVVKSHAVRDALGRVLCPKLRTYICPICKASGDMAHTVKYCPQKPIVTMDDALRAETVRLTKNSVYKPQMKV